jgi:hypothetical protein
MDLKTFLSWAAEVGAAYLGFWIIERITLEGPPSTWSALQKRLMAYAITAGLATIAFLALIAMQYTPAPATARGWIEAIFLVSTTAFGLGQIIHGGTKLDRGKRAMLGPRAPQM